MDYESILDEAKEITGNDRMKQYGHPESSFTDIARYWNAYLKSVNHKDIEAKDVSMMMILLKIARESNKSKRDNLVDIAGYARTSAILEDLE